MNKLKQRGRFQTISKGVRINQTPIETWKKKEKETYLLSGYFKKIKPGPQVVACKTLKTNPKKWSRSLTRVNVGFFRTGQKRKGGAGGWGGGVLPMMTYTGRLRPKGVPFPGLGISNGDENRFRTTCHAIRKNVKNLFSEVKATSLDTTPYLTLVNAVVLFCWRLRSRVIASFRRMFNSNQLKQTNVSMF